MRIEFVLIADAVEAVNGKLYLLGGGWNEYKAATVPVAARMGVAISLQYGQNEVGPHLLRLNILDDTDQAVIPEAQGQMELKRATSHGLPESRGFIAINLSLPLPRFATYRVRVNVDDLEQVVFFAVVPAEIPVTNPSESVLN